MCFCLEVYFVYFVYFIYFVYFSIFCIFCIFCVCRPLFEAHPTVAVVTEPKSLVPDAINQQLLALQIAMITVTVRRHRGINTLATSRYNWGDSHGPKGASGALAL